MSHSTIFAHQLTLHSNDRHVLKPVLDAIDLQIPEGAVVGLMGRNGAGKSTLLRCLVGLTVPTLGRSALLGVPSLALNDEVRERLGFVAQTPDLFGHMQVWQHIEFVGQAYQGWEERRVLALAGMLELPLGRRVEQLSGGDQQKLAVLLALAHDPDLLLMDEPVSSLDPLSRREFLRALFAVRDTERPRTVMISSHLLSDLERVVSHVLFLREGRVQCFDTWDNLAEHLRIAPAEAHPQAEWLYAGSDGQCVVDTRSSTPHSADRPLNLEQLFVALNSPSSSSRGL